jgi:hypothetical protein
LSRLGAKIDGNSLLPGDLVFFNTRRFAFSHVGIYLGDDKFIHAPRRGKRVRIATMTKRYWQSRFTGARRLVDAMTPELPLVRDIQALAADAVVEAPEANAAEDATDTAP